MLGHTCLRLEQCSTGSTRTVNVTLARYWDRFTKEDMDFLLWAINMNRTEPLHMGKLPFVSATVAYKAVWQYPTSGNKDSLTVQKLLQVLQPSYFHVHTEMPKDWKQVNQKIIRPPE